MRGEVGVGGFGSGWVGRGVVRQAQQGRQVRFGGWLLVGAGRGARGLWQRWLQRAPLRDGLERVRPFLRKPGNREARITVSSRCQALIREFGNYRYHEPQEHHPISEQPIDADNHAIKALCYWLYDRFGAVRPRGPRRSIPFRITW